VPLHRCSIWEILLPPPPAFTRCNPGVTGSTETHQVRFGMSSAPGDWHDMVDFIGRSEFAGLPALFAQRVGCDVSVADTFPRHAIPFACRRVALIFFVLPVGQFLMFVAISAVRKFRTVRITARTHRLLRHKITLTVKIESPRSRLLQRLSDIFRYYYYSI